MIVNNYKFDNDKLSLTLDGDEDLIGTYYVKSDEELLYLKDNIKYGVSLKIKGKLEVPSNNTIPNTFNYKKYLLNKGIRYRLVIDSIVVIDSNIGVIYSLKNIINNRIDNIDNTGYMKAFILGIKDDIDDEVYTSYQKIGITHLFALSGMHVGLLSGIILKILKKVSIIKKYTIINIILVIYGFIVGYPSSIKRCILFFIFNSINKIFKLDISTFKILLLVIFSLIIYEYKIIYDIGFIYSICTVGGIILCNNYINHDNKLISSFRLSLVAFIFSLPISLSSFYEVNLLSIFYNMVFVPYVSIIVYPLSLISFMIPSLSFIFSLSIKLLEVCSSYLSTIRYFSFYLDFNMVEIIIYYLVTIFMFYKNEYRLSILLILIVIIDIMISYLDSNGYVYFFDVGQGDSSLVISPYRKDIILIDTGGSLNYHVSDNVISFMKSIGIRSIDLLILSHGDSDHALEVDNIFKDINIKCLNTNLGDFNDLEINAMKLIDTCLYEPKNMVLKYLNYDVYDNENDNSLLTYMNIYNSSILSLGDASSKVEDSLINKYKLSNIDIFKLSHHGSKTSSSYYFLNSIKPNIAVISSGRNNKFKHPSKETIDTLNKLSINYLNTQNEGSIEFIIDRDGYRYVNYGT
ncbi:MAG: DNA internalization-related competence protein ComEC/Rec2 [Firmicutes bacterium]|nr:DNA internalization-related competence protein ComEC/Rec2 [Bacillota bacterium]